MNVYIHIGVYMLASDQVRIKGLLEPKILFFTFKRTRFLAGLYTITKEYGSQFLVKLFPHVFTIILRISQRLVAKYD